jgi:Holliday junction DNA helicase RuvA
VIERLRGTVAVREADGVVIEVGGIGFRMEASATTLRDLPGEGETASVFTHLHVREDALQLYAFSSEDERDLFLMFIGVSKIGPKLALAALSARRPPDVRRALATGDVALFQAVPGIGKKTAERLILELREKAGQSPGLGGASARSGPSEGDSTLSLARAALLELGLTAVEAEARLRDADLDQPLDALVRAALRPLQR